MGRPCYSFTAESDCERILPEVTDKSIEGPFIIQNAQWQSTSIVWLICCLLSSFCVLSISRFVLI